MKYSEGRDKPSPSGDVYEAMTWIVFYPRTLWWSAVSPLRMLRYGQRELADSPDDQYTETLSPVLFLMITLALSHGLSQALAPAAMELRGAMARLMSSEQNQLITRSVAFAISLSSSPHSSSGARADRSIATRCGRPSTPSAS